MTEHPEYESEPTEADRLLDLYLATLPRFEPKAGFADRVMARVAVERPGAVTVPSRRHALPALFRKPAFGWSVAGSTALSSTALTVWVAANLEAISTTVTAVTLDAGTTAWQALLGLVAMWSAWTGATAAAVLTALGPGPVISATAAAVLAMPLSILGLWLAFRPAQLSRTRIHASR